MEKHKRKTYFKTIRLRSGLSQLDVAFLMGNNHHDHISKIESTILTPRLKTVCAYTIIFNVHHSELMPTYIEDLRTKIRTRARERLPALEALPPSKSKEARIAKIKQLINSHKSME